MLSASAVALLALTGTVYGTESVSPTNESDTTSQETQNSTQEGTDNVESSAEDKAKEESESKAKEEAESKAEAESLAKEQEKIDEQSKLDAVTKEASKEEVDETKVVPLEDLPIDEDTGLLDFAEYHKIAKGRALPRELTEEEEKEFKSLNNQELYYRYNECFPCRLWDLKVGMFLHGDPIVEILEDSRIVITKDSKNNFSYHYVVPTYTYNAYTGNVLI